MTPAWPDGAKIAGSRRHAVVGPNRKEQSEKDFAELPADETRMLVRDNAAKLTGSRCKRLCRQECVYGRKRRGDTLISL
jgi:hypothetical protein